jgi:hypothetical protein
MFVDDVSLNILRPSRTNSHFPDIQVLYCIDCKAIRELGYLSDRGLLGDCVLSLQTRPYPRILRKPHLEPQKDDRKHQSLFRTFLKGEGISSVSFRLG